MEKLAAIRNGIAMNNTIGILEWTNENSNSSYPLSQPFPLQDFIVDATFVQFDGFVPVLKMITIEQGQATIVLTTDAGDVPVVVSCPPVSYFPGYAVEFRSGERYLGQLVFGQGLVTLFTMYLNTVLKPNIPFVPSVVRGVSSHSGVYAIAGYVGNVNVYTGPSPQNRTIFFGIAGNQVTWNAGWLGNQIQQVPLKTLNGVLPVEGTNALFIEDSDLIKVTPQGDGILVSVVVPLANEVVSPVTSYA